MKIRRFYSSNMRTALRQVSEEFGDDAAILSSQKTANGVEVIAALDYDENLLPTSKKNQTENPPEVAEQASLNNTETVPLESHQQAVMNQMTGVNESEFNENELNGDKPRLIKSNNRSTSKAKNRAVEWVSDPGLDAMREELGLMRSMMSEQLKGIGWERFSEKDPVSAMLARRLSALGISQAIANRLIPQVKPQQDAECCWQNLLALLAKSMISHSHNLLEKGGSYAFMGPSGSGKTSTIAKLAARFIIQHGVDSVGLISTDGYGMSAQQQLGNFARLLGIPMLSVSSKHNLEHLLHQFKNKKLILIDTASLSKNKNNQSLMTLKNTNHNIKRFLMIPATNQLTVIKHSIELAKAYSPYGVIISKLDEATSLGEVLSTVISNQLPVAFTCDGQKIPENIRTARSHQLVSKAVCMANKYGAEVVDWQLAQELQPVKSA